MGVVRVCHGCGKGVFADLNNSNMKSGVIVAGLATS